MLAEGFTFDAARLLGEGLAGATGGAAVGSDFESGANEPMIMRIATTAIAIAHHRRHQGRFCRAEAVGGGADQVVACVGGACSECGSRPSRSNTGCDPESWGLDTNPRSLMNLSSSSGHPMCLDRSR